MGLFSVLTDFSDMLKLSDGHPLKQKFERSLNTYCIQRWGRAIITDPTEQINPAEATIQEIRNAATSLYQEADRLEALPGANRLFAVRSPGHKDFLFIDKEEKEARNWSLHNPSDDRRLYEEWWVIDSSVDDKALRRIKSIPMDIPTLTARNQVAVEQASSQRKQTI